MKVTRAYYMLMVADMERAKRFYRDTIGLKERHASPEWTELTWGDATVALHGGAKEDARDTGLGFDVDDVDAACAAVAKAGGKVVQPPQKRPGESITLATVQDPEGNRFFFAQPNR